MSKNTIPTLFALSLGASLALTAVRPEEARAFEHCIDCDQFTHLVTQTTWHRDMSFTLYKSHVVWVTMWEDAQGLLWLLMWMPSPSWEAGPPMARGRQMNPEARTTLSNRPRAETIIEVVDLERRRVLARSRLEHSPGFAFGGGYF